MQFRNAKSAVKWAENRLNRSQVKSCLASLLKTEQSGSLDLTAEELDDVAQTVTHIAQNIKQPKGPALLAVYGLNRPARHWVLADMMVLFARQMSFPGLEQLNENQMKTFMLCVISDIRMIEEEGVTLPKTKYYDICGLNAYQWRKFQLYELRGLSQTMLQSWLDEAAKQLEVELDAIDMFAT